MTSSSSSSSSRVPDQELKKAFTELQEKMIDTSQKLKLSDVQIESLKRTKQRAELTIKEMATLEPSTKTYESVGRMFLLDDIKSIKTDLETRMRSADERIKSLDNNKTYLQRSLKESEDNLREMVQLRQGKETTTTG